MVLAPDPGKDLFAYLFLLIMVFAFMLLMSFDQRDSGAAQSAPAEKKVGITGLHVVDKDRVGRIIKEKDTLLLRYGPVVYDPATDFDRLTADGRIVEVPEKNGKPKRFIYIERKKGQTVSLFEYLDAFQIFSNHQVSVAFAREVQ